MPLLVCLLTWGPACEKPDQQEVLVQEGPAPPPVRTGHSIQGSTGEPRHLTEFGKALHEGSSLANEGQLERAEGAFRRAVLLKPEHPVALASLAEVLFRQDEVDEAAELAIKAYTLGPREAEVQWVLGVVMVRSGRNVSAGAEAWRALLRDHPEYAEAMGVPKLLEDLRRFTGSGESHQ